MKRQLRFSSSSSPLALCVLYCAGSCFWIVFTDKVLNQLPLSPAAATRWSIAKGLLFVFVSSVLIYLSLKRVNRLNRELEAMVALRTSALVKSEQHLQKSEERLRALLANLPDVTWTAAASGETIYISPNVERVTGYTSKEVCEGGAEFWLGRIHPEDSQRVHEAFQRLFDEGPSFDLEYRFKRRDERWIWIYDRAISTHEEGGAFYADGIFSDVTERKNSEAARWAILRGALDGYYLTDMQGRILEVNDSYCTMSGYKREELLQLSLRDLECMESEAEIARHMHQIKTHHSDRFETRHRRKDGGIIDIETSVTLQGEQFVCFLRDVTERKRSEQEVRALEEQLLQAQKMEAIGRLAGGIAHDFNNLLMVIRSYSEMLQEGLQGDERLQRYAREVLKSADRAAGLTGQMLAFSRKQMLAPVVLDLNLLLDECVKMLERLIGEDIEVKVNASEALWAIEADSDQMFQVLMNLCVNARDAMPQGGELVLVTRNVSVGADVASRHACMVPGEYVMLSVTDTGEGMSEEIQKHVFEPFFTTKEVGGGTGLGLSTVYGIVKQSNGYVWCDSEKGNGTTFSIYLPRVKQALAPIAASHVDEIQRGSETILVVEDEGALRTLVCDFLTSLGYDVIAADGGQQALAVANAHDGAIDVLVTDVVMPKMSGRQLSQTLREIRPELKTIYMSGYTDDAVVRHGIRGAALAFLQKPFSLATLGQKVREVIGATHGK
jgi:PAS domain S-box-containing protein